MEDKTMDEQAVNMVNELIAKARVAQKQFALCFVPVIPSSTTAQSRDSIAPSIAIENAAGSSVRIESQVIVALGSSMLSSSQRSLFCSIIFTEIPILIKIFAR